MRMVPGFEKKQRGCLYCADAGTTKFKQDNRTSCPHTVCPYHVLDKYKSYDEFIASEDSMILVPEFFTTVAVGFERMHGRFTPIKGFSDGDSRVNL